jgi:hypothetical protein
MNISSSISEFNVSSLDGVRGAKIYAWPGYRQAAVEKISPTELDIHKSAIQILLPKEERDEVIRSFIESKNLENKNDSLYTSNGKNYAASFAVAGTLFSALV